MLIQKITQLPPIDSVPEVIALDFETKEDSMDVEGFSFATAKKAYFVPVAFPFDEDDKYVNVPEALAYVKKLVQGRRIIMHNAGFDLTVLRRKNIEIPDARVEDSMLMHWVLDTERRHGLKEIMVTELGVPREEVLTYKKARSADFKTFAEYGERDARQTYRLYEKLREEIQKHPNVQSLYREVEIPYMRVLQRMNYDKNCIRIDEVLLDKYIARVEKEIELVSDILRDKLGDINFNSTQQLARVLKKKGYKIALTEKGNPSLDEGELRKLKGKIIDAILYYRGLVKLNSTYLTGLKPLLRRVRYKGEKITILQGYNFNQVGTRGGRTSCTDPNMQNQPRDRVYLMLQISMLLGKKGFMSDEEWEIYVETQKDTYPKEFKHGEIDIRRLYIALPGHVLIDADYSQLELRMMAHFSQDAVMMAAYREGKDIHQETADRLNAQIGGSISRQEAKTLNFALQYLMYYTTLAKRLGISVTEAKEIWLGYQKLFSGRTKFIKEFLDSVRKSHFAQTLLGRRRNLHTLGINDYSKEGFSRRFHAESGAVSHVISGSSADLIKVAQINLHRKYPHILQRLQVHDELLCEVREEDAEKCLKIIVHEMENALKLRVPIVAEAKIAKNWRDCH